MVMLVDCSYKETCMEDTMHRHKNLQEIGLLCPKNTAISSIHKCQYFMSNPKEIRVNSNSAFKIRVRC